MIKHVVMWKFKPGEEENVKKFLAGLEGLRDQIEVLKDMEIGVNCNPDCDYDAVLISEFDSLEDLNTYKTDPRHVAVSKLCKSIRVSRTAVDYTV